MKFRCKIEGDPIRYLGKQKTNEKWYDSWQISQWYLEIMYGYIHSVISDIYLNL